MYIASMRASLLAPAQNTPEIGSGHRDCFRRQGIPGRIRLSLEFPADLVAQRQDIARRRLFAIFVMVAGLHCAELGHAAASGRLLRQIVEMPRGFRNRAHRRCRQARLTHCRRHVEKIDAFLAYSPSYGGK
jgi:hypothetical protein